MKHQTRLLLVVVVAQTLAARTLVSAFCLQRSSCPSAARDASSQRSAPLMLSDDDNNEWSVTDDWSRLSSENPRNSAPESHDIFNQDIAQRAAFFMEGFGDEGPTKSKEEVWMSDALDTILQAPEVAEGEQGGIQQPADANNKGGTLHTKRFLDEMGREIALLVRCNESPQDMLVSQGRALPPLLDEERDDPEQLVRLSSDKDDDSEWQATPFLRKAVAAMFQQHCTPAADDDDDVSTRMVLDRKGIASWMTKALGESEKKAGVVGKHDLRVTTTVSKYGAYGKGHLTLEDFQRLYLQAVVGQIPTSIKNPATLWGQLRLGNNGSSVQSVWRDIRNHGIRSPVEEERAKEVEKMNARLGRSAGTELVITVDEDADTLLDECEIVDFDDTFTVSQTTDREGASSHEDVKLAPGSKTPVWMKDGEFVFIDEESCIGCMQCTAAAPASFRMVENGRARTYTQRKSPEVEIAVSTCPVDCMHYVSFDELEELETARDHGDGRDDHRHFGHSKSRGYVGRIPLYVSGIDSDANHRSSWYHYLKNKCFMSSDCPKRGCFACPSYEHGKNPYFLERMKRSNHVRAEYFKKTGVADAFRKTADL